MEAVRSIAWNDNCEWKNVRDIAWNADYGRSAIKSGAQHSSVCES